MASRDRGRQRIEPGFSSDRRSGDDLRADPEDRPVAKRKTVRKSTKSKRGKSRRGSGSGGFFGLLRRAVYWSFVLCIWGGIALAGTVIYFAAKMPQTTTWSIPDRPPNVKIVSVEGDLIANRGASGGEAISLHDMSPYLPEAVVAIEDRRFYSHFGVDPIGFARAMAANVMSGRLVQGGSTITQQLAKNLFLTPDRTIERKVQEVLLALWLEQKYTKDQILEMYLNRVYLGSGSYGVAAASRRYFDKSAKEVTLPEAALIAGLLKAPSRLSPARDPKAASERAQLVLAAMREQGMIGDKELTFAMKQPATRAASYWSGSEQYVADRVMEELPGLIGDVRSDVIVDTTVDLGLQKLGEASIRDLISKNGEKLNVSQGAMVSIDGTGAVRALIGGYDYANSQFDRASEAKRQPGSAFKPFVYLSALEQGFTPESVRNDAPIRIGNWTPGNYNGKYFGKVTLAEALARSLNSVSAQLVMEVGPKTVVSTAHRLGIESNLTSNASLALGTSEVTLLELTDSFVPFANGGYKAPLHIIRRVTTNEGKVLYEYKSPAPNRVIDLRNVGMINAMLRQTVESGTATKAKFGWPAAGKTGTSQNFRDAWFIGYTSNLATGVWFGNDDGRPTKKITGGSLPAIAWKDFMVAAHKGVPVASLPGEYQLDQQVNDGNDILPSSGVDPAAPASEGVPSAQLNPAGPMPPVDVGNQTGSTRPVPPANVGSNGQKGRKTTTLFDLIMGN
ncbi:penicillin-binding protein [Phyllobacterium brassicacearum]|uniref:Penicillin-binding protein n=1 Tax=Phyllobacterium brassicacearum TaxID=314235 RepID=A0A2P7BMD4_9HYPH|nr:transglycosylase domain-containing protein [Phyllobacterium brassicacearum]PSH67610.1 penicillin-binding protein [Phyllobacterium brassicacearum]TDQ25842.1 penicillin-binding protein 1A [Phyllobacterium brassicacearum]